MNNGTFGLPRNAKLPSHFSQDGGIARPWLEKAREGFKSVKDFGAQGAGRDETRQIQAALDAAKRASVPLFIPSGFYSVSNASGPALNISYTDLTQEPATERKRVDILGEGVGASVIRPASSAQFGLKITGGPGIQASHYWQVSRLSFGAGVLGARGLHVFDAAFLEDQRCGLLRPSPLYSP